MTRYSTPTRHRMITRSQANAQAQSPPCTPVSRKRALICPPAPGRNSKHVNLNLNLIQMVDALQDTFNANMNSVTLTPNAPPVPPSTPVGIRGPLVCPSTPVGIRGPLVCPPKPTRSDRR